MSSPPSHHSQYPYDTYVEAASRNGPSVLCCGIYIIHTYIDIQRSRGEWCVHDLSPTTWSSSTTVLYCTYWYSPGDAVVWWVCDEEERNRFVAECQNQSSFPGLDSQHLVHMHDRVCVYPVSHANRAKHHRRLRCDVEPTNEKTVSLTPSLDTLACRA